MDVYLTYARACGIFGVCIFFFFTFSANIFVFVEKWWLKVWADAGELEGGPTHTLFYYVGIYGLISVSVCIFAVVRSISSTQFSAIRASSSCKAKLASSK